MKIAWANPWLKTRSSMAVWGTCCILPTSLLKLESPSDEPKEEKAASLHSSFIIFYISIRYTFSLMQIKSSFIFCGNPAKCQGLLVSVALAPISHHHSSTLVLTIALFLRPPQKDPRVTSHIKKVTGDFIYTWTTIALHSLSIYPFYSLLLIRNFFA